MISPVPSRSTRESLEIAAVEYRSQLPGSPGESLLLERMISPKTQGAFELGYVESPISGHEKYRGMLTIPYRTAAGLVGMRFKRVAGEGGKAKAWEGLPTLPYDVGSLSRSGPLFIVEGEPDRWAAFECGLNAVGIPGVDAWKPTWSRLFRNFPDIRVLEQGDVNLLEGQNVTAAQKLTRDIRASGVFFSTIEFPRLEDVNSMLIKDGKEAVREFVGMEDGE